jgi:hypothetical protein
MAMAMTMASSISKIDATLAETMKSGYLQERAPYKVMFSREASVIAPFDGVITKRNVDVGKPRARQRR